MYKCDDIFDKTDEYLDGELSKEECAKFEKHLENCEECRKNVEFAKQLNNIMHGMPSVEPPTDFLDNLHKKIAAEGKAVRFYKKWQPYGALAACILLAVVIRTNVVRDLNDSTSYLNMATPTPAVQSQTADTSAEETQREIQPEVAENEEVVMAKPEKVQDLQQAENDVATVSEPTEQSTEDVQHVIVENPTVTAVSTPVATPIPNEIEVPEEAAVEIARKNAVAVQDEDNAPTEAADVPVVFNLPTVASETNEADYAVETPDPEYKVPPEGYGGNTAIIGGGGSGLHTGGSAPSSSSGGGGGSSTSTGAGGSSNATWTPSASTTTSPRTANYISAEHKSDVEAIIASLGIQKNGTIYSAGKAVFEQFVAELEKKDIPFDGIYTDMGESVQFVIEWE